MLFLTLERMVGNRETDSDDVLCLRLVILSQTIHGCVV